MNTLITVEAWNILVSVHNWLAKDLIDKINYATEINASDFAPFYDAKDFLESHKFDLQDDFYEKMYGALNNGVGGSLDEFFNLMREQIKMRDTGITEGRDEIQSRMSALYNKLVKEYEHALRQVQSIAEQARSQLPTISLPALKIVGGAVIIGSPNSPHGNVSTTNKTDSSSRAYNISGSQVGIVGDRNQAKNISNEGLSYTNREMQELVPELLRLRKELATAAETPEHFDRVAAVARAHEAAKKNDAQGLTENLKKAGKWALAIATSIGVPIAVDALKRVVLS
jgi:hypothetical protein